MLTTNAQKASISYILFNRLFASSCLFSRRHTCQYYNATSLIIIIINNNNEQIWKIRVDILSSTKFKWKSCLE